MPTVISRQEEIVLRDLQSLLRKTIGQQVQLVSYSIASLLPKGENFASTMLKVDAVIKKTKISPEEKLWLVAKMIPSTDYQKSVLNMTGSFKKEIFIYEKLMNVYRQIELQAGVRPENLIDLLPKFYGGRLSLDKKEADSDTVLLMENINTTGYRTMNRMKGLDLKQASLAITELARFHALGMATKQKMPEFFEEVKKYVDVSPFTATESDFMDLVKHIINAICADPRIAKYEDRIRSAVFNKDWESLMNVKAVEPWVTVIHGDFWVNNIMFRKECEKINDVKFVDFQASRICSPLKDLPYFLCTSTNMEVLDNHFDELLDTYYNKFIRVLKSIGCDVSSFSKKSFNEQLKKDANDELFHCLMAVKFFTLEANDDADLNDVKSSLFSENSSLYLDQSWKVVSKFIEKAWI